MIRANSGNRNHIYGLENRHNKPLYYARKMKINYPITQFDYTLNNEPDWNEDFYPDLLNMM